MNTIDLTTLPANVPSLCIPRVFPNIDERRIRGVFESLDMGEIERVDIVKKTTEKGEKFNRVFIHWKRWNSSDNANQSRNRLLNGKEIKIIYDDPWFWKISAFKESTIRPSPSTNKPLVRIQFDTDEDITQKPRQEQRPRQDQRPRQEQKPRQEQRPRQDQRPRQEQRPRQRQSSSTPNTSLSHNVGEVTQEGVKNTQLTFKSKNEV